MPRQDVPPDASFLLSELIRFAEARVGILLARIPSFFIFLIPNPLASLGLVALPMDCPNRVCSRSQLCDPDPAAAAGLAAATETAVIALG